MDPFLHTGFNTGTHPALVLSGLVKIRQRHKLLELKCPSSMISCLEELISLLGKALERDPHPVLGVWGGGNWEATAALQDSNQRGSWCTWKPRGTTAWPFSGLLVLVFFPDYTLGTGCGNLQRRQKRVPGSWVRAWGCAPSTPMWKRRWGPESAQET